VISKGTVVLHSCVDLQRVVSTSCSEMRVTPFQDESETMDIKLDITDVKEEQEDPLAIPITCPALDVEQEVSLCVCVCMCMRAQLHRFPRQ
jgi:hypothetical protein